MMSAQSLVLMYHRIAAVTTDPWSLCVSPDHFAEHLAVIASACRPVRLTRVTTAVQRLVAPTRAVVITFDDGYADNVEQALPLLAHYDVPATIFVATGNIGTTREFWWDTLERTLLWPGTLPAALVVDIGGARHEWTLDDDAQYDAASALRHRGWTTAATPPTARHRVYLDMWQLLQRSATEDRELAVVSLRRWAGLPDGADPSTAIMTEADVVSLAQCPLIEIGAHSVTHPALGECTPAEQRQEISGSGRKLEELMGRPVTSFSYPYGSFTATTQSIVRDAGFRRACSTRDTTLGWHDDRFALPRMQVLNWTGDEFARQLTLRFDGIQ